jgi:hypothetical protein
MNKFYYLYSYNISKLKPSNRVRLVYVLKGRGKEKGLIKKLNGKSLAPACFIIPIKQEKEIQEVFKFWKVPFKRIKIMLTN